MRIVAVFVMLGAGFGTAFGQSTAQPAEPLRSTTAGSVIDPDSGSRLPLLTREDMHDEASASIYDTFAGPGGEPPLGTIAVALYSPETARALGRIDDYLRNESTLGPRLFEFLSLIAAREMDLTYEWSAHEGNALRVGLEPAVIEVVRMSEPVSGLSDYDALIINFGRQLFRNRHVDSGTFAALVGRLGRQKTFDAIMALTYHALAGVIQRAVNLRPPAGWDPADLPAVASVGTPTGRPGEFVELGPRPLLPPDVQEDSYYRFPLLRREELNPRGREVFDRFVETGRDAAPRGPVGMTFNSPELVEPIQQLNTLLRVNGVLNRRMTEIVITATGREMNSQYQWIVHGAAAERAGAGHEVLEAIRNDEDLSGLDNRDAIVIAFTRELFREGTVRSETFAAAVNLFGAQGTVEIAELIGDYLMITTVYNALGVRLRPDQEPTLPHRAGAPVGAEWR